MNLTPDSIMGGNRGDRREREREKSELYSIKENLILLVQQHTLIWLTSHPDHNDKNKQINAWVDILYRLRECHGPLLAAHSADDIKALKSIWKSLKDYYFVRKKAQQMTPLPGSDLAAPELDPKWPFFKSLEFLSVNGMPQPPINASAAMEAVGLNGGSNRDSNRDSNNSREDFYWPKEEEDEEWGDGNIEEASDNASSSRATSSCAGLGASSGTAPWSSVRVRKRARTQQSFYQSSSTTSVPAEPSSSEPVTVIEPELDAPTAFSKYILAQMRKMSERKMLQFQKEVMELAIEIVEEETEKAATRAMENSNYSTNE